MKIFKLVSIMLLALSLVFVSACSSNGGNSTDKPQESTQPDKTATEPTAEPAQKLLFVGWSGEQELAGPPIKSYMKSWDEANAPDSISWMGWPWGQTLEQLLIRGQGKEAMDVAQVDIGWLKTLNDAGLLLDMNTAFDQKWLTDNYSEAYLKMGQVDGKQVALPWTVAATSLVKNPSILQAAGITQDPATIEEFEAALKKIKASNKDVVPYAFDTKDEEMSTDFQVWLKMFGSDVFDDSGKVIINNEGGVKAVTWMKSLLDQGLVKMDIAKYDARQLFIQGKAAYIDDSIIIKGNVRSAGVADADLPSKVSPALRPVVKAGDAQVSKLWGHMLVIPTTAVAPKKSASFIQHLVGPESALDYFTKVGQLPVVKEAIANEKVQNDPISKGWLELTEFSITSDTERTSIKKVLDKIIVEEVQAAMLGAKQPQKAMDDAASRISAALK